MPSGPHASEPKFPGHGFARTVPWEIIETQKLGNGATRFAERLGPGSTLRLGQALAVTE